jgi:hypothetical protein
LLPNRLLSPGQHVIFSRSGRLMAARVMGLSQPHPRRYAYPHSIRRGGGRKDGPARLTNLDVGETGLTGDLRCC